MGVKIGVYSKCIAFLMHKSILQFFKHCPYRTMMLFSEVGVLLGIEDFDCITLQVKQASSTPYMPLDILSMSYKFLLLTFQALLH